MKQLKGIYWLGALKNVQAEAAANATIFQIFAMMAVLYTTTIQPWFYVRGIEIPMAYPILAVVILWPIWMVINWAVLIPAHYAFLKRQFVKYGNFTEEDMAKLLDNQNKIMKKLGMHEDGL